MFGTAAGILMASVVGSVHCAGMCGGFVCFYTGAEPAAANQASRGGALSSPLHAHALYNVGRLLSYLLLGAVAGVIGSRISDLGALAGVQHAATLVAGALMVAWALSTLAAQRGLSLGRMHAPRVWQQALGRVLLTVRTQPIAVRALLTGLVTTLLPCGWLYVFVATAGGTGSVLSAMAFMAVFWLGTVPALIAVGVGAQTVLAPFRQRLPMLSATVVLVMGLWSMTGHLRAPRANDHHDATAMTPSALPVEPTAIPTVKPAVEMTHVH